MSSVKWSDFSKQAFLAVVAGYLTSFESHAEPEITLGQRANRSIKPLAETRRSPERLGTNVGDQRHALSLTLTAPKREKA